MWGERPARSGRRPRRASTVVEDFAPVRDASATPANGAAYPPTRDLGKALGDRGAHDPRPTSASR